MTRLRRASRGARRRALEAVHALPARPLISVVMPTYETPPRYLREAIESVRAQSYPDWELCITDDGSTERAVRDTIDRLRVADQRIKVSLLANNKGISAASNAALELAKGEFVGFLDHDDVLTADALLTVAQRLAAEPELDIIYSDQDKLDGHGRRADPFLKPDWSPVYALGAMYVGHLLIVRRTLIEQVGGFDPAFDKIQDFELLLRLSERTERIFHIPEILYHWRAIPGSIAAGAEQKSGVPSLQAHAVNAHLERRGEPVRVKPHATIPHRAVLVADGPVADPGQDVSVVVAWTGADRDLTRLLGSLGQDSPGGAAEVIVVAASGVEPAAGLPAGCRLIVDRPGPLSRARAANLGAREARGRLILFCAETLEFPGPDSLAELTVPAGLSGVGAVGPLLVRPDGRTEAAGIALGLRAPALPMLAGIPGDADGYYGAMVCAREVSAVSARCMLVDAKAFERLGGFNEAYRNEYHDFDLCRRLRAECLSAIYTPRPAIVDHEPPSAARRRTDVIDRALFVDTWYEQLEAGDPYYNHGFDGTSAGFEPAAPDAR